MAWPPPFRLHLARPHIPATRRASRPPVFRIPLVLCLALIAHAPLPAQHTSPRRGPRQLSLSAVYNRLSTGAFRLAFVRDLGRRHQWAYDGGGYWQGGFALEGYGFKAEEPDDRYDFALTYEIGRYGRTRRGFTAGVGVFGGVGAALESVTRLTGGSLEDDLITAPLYLFGLRPRVGFTRRTMGRVPWEVYASARLAVDFFPHPDIPYSGHAHAGPELGFSFGLAKTMVEP